ncbi:hypothetical protein S83_014423 [Arachis hypogaea]
MVYGGGFSRNICSFASSFQTQKATPPCNFKRSDSLSFCLLFLRYIHSHTHSLPHSLLPSFLSLNLSLPPSPPPFSHHKVESDVYFVLFNFVVLGGSLCNYS